MALPRARDKSHYPHIHNGTCVTGQPRILPVVGGLSALPLWCRSRYDWTELYVRFRFTEALGEYGKA
jgi:hypothetical protein